MNLVTGILILVLQNHSSLVLIHIFMFFRITIICQNTGHRAQSFVHGIIMMNWLVWPWNFVILSASFESLYRNRLKSWSTTTIFWRNSGNLGFSLGMQYVAFILIEFLPVLKVVKCLKGCQQFDCSLTTINLQKKRVKLEKLYSMCQFYKRFKNLSKLILILAPIIFFPSRF